MEGAFQLSKRIVKNFYNNGDIDIYNKQMEIFFNNSIDFVNMHYIISKRPGKFWEEGRKLDKSDSMMYYENNLEENLNGHILNDSNFFTGSNWKCWLKQR